LKNVLAPSVRATIAIGRNDASYAIELLRTAPPFEMGTSAYGLLPVYLRGQAYLRMRAGKEAAIEFQKVVDHRGVAPLSVLHMLARPGLARAYALQGDTAKSRAAYQEFLTLWKDADPDVPILKEAKAEYAKLQ
jgi:eukaryotic-like serine/threonine-protein kinase